MMRKWPAALNQEAGKAVTYGNMSEEDALKLVTLTLQKCCMWITALVVLKQVRMPILVVWSADPLSIYAVAEKTYVDGIPYWDIRKDAENQKAMKTESGRIIQKMLEAKSTGAPLQRVPVMQAAARVRVRNIGRRQLCSSR
jgi:hypothetical protein